ncbi:hypothetical protein EMMF5_000539 [Cystobasidiomycetes sp. EMM_F5]
MTEKIVLHHLEQSRSQRILWLLEELEIDYDIKEYPRINGLAPAELKAIHPTGKSPVITDGPRTIAESGAIVQYLISKYGKGRFVIHDDEDKQLDDTFFQHFAEGSLMPPLVMKLVLTKAEASSPFFIRPIVGLVKNGIFSGYIDPNLKRIFAMINGYLERDGGRQWLAGGNEPTGADFMMEFPLEAGIYGGRLESSLLTPRIREYVERTQARPAYQRALKKAPGYVYVPKEKL